MARVSCLVKVDRLKIDPLQSAQRRKHTLFQDNIPLQTLVHPCFAGLALSCWTDENQKIKRIRVRFRPQFRNTYPFLENLPFYHINPAYPGQVLTSTCPRS